MARATQEDLTGPPEINLARRIAKKHNLRPPIDIGKLARTYARLVITDLPDGLDVDGATFDLKTPGKTVIVVNNERPITRKRFTIAHELGHVLIPWHIGAILDEVVLFPQFTRTHYSFLESEANRFASEILMPAVWLSRVIDLIPSPPEALKHVASHAQVSSLAALLALNNSLPSGYVFAVLSDIDGRVLYSGRSPGTLANAPEYGSRIIDKRARYPTCDNTPESSETDGLYVWWHLPEEVDLPSPIDRREWRIVLDHILDDLAIPATDRVKLKQTLNGIFGYAKGAATKQNVESIFSAALQRFHSNADRDRTIRRFVKHKSFESFVRKRSEDAIKQPVKALGRKTD